MGEPTIVAAPKFDAEADAKALRAAMKGLGTDEDAIIAIICARSTAQLHEVKSKYAQSFGRVLIDDLKSETSGKFEKIILSRMMTAPEFDAHVLKHAVKGLGTDETALIEIMCTRNNAELEQIKDAYKKEYKKDLMKDLVGDTSGDFKRFLVSMDAASRNEDDSVDDSKAEAEAKELYGAGEDRAGTDEETFNRIFALRSHAQLRRTFEIYQHKYNKKDGILGAINGEFSGSIKECYRAVATCVLVGRESYFADQLFNSMHGMGTNDDQLMRLILSRCEVDLKTVKVRFQQRHKKLLEKMIEGDTSGDYKKSLIRLAVGNN